LQEDENKFPESVDIEEIMDFRISEILPNFYPSAIYTKVQFMETFKNVSDIDNGTFRLYLDPTGENIIGYFYDDASIDSWRNATKRAIAHNRFGSLMLALANACDLGFSCGDLPDDWYATAAMTKEYVEATKVYTDAIMANRETEKNGNTNVTFEELQDRLDVLPYFWSDDNVDNLIKYVVGEDDDEEEEDEDEALQNKVASFTHDDIDTVEKLAEAISVKEDPITDDDIDDLDDADEIEFDVADSVPSEEVPSNFTAKQETSEDDSMVVKKLN
jgi:hypothetical protein